MTTITLLGRIRYQVQVPYGTYRSGLTHVDTPTTIVVDADPDPTTYCDADPDFDLDSTPSFKHFRKSDFFTFNQRGAILHLDSIFDSIGTDIVYLDIWLNSGSNKYRTYPAK